jgi:transposase
MQADALPRDYPLREVYNGLRWTVRAGAEWRMLPTDLPPWHTVYQHTPCWLRARVVAASEHALCSPLFAQADRATGGAAHYVGAGGDPRVAVVVVDNGSTGEEPAQAAEAKHSFVLLPRRRMLERSFAWLAGSRCLTRDYERLPETLAGLHFLAFLMVWSSAL